MQAGPQSSNQGVCSADFGVYTNSIVVKNSDDTVTYSEGTDYTVEVSDRTLSGYGQTRLFGRTVILKTSGGSISDGQTLNVTYSYLSKRFNDLTYYPNPAKSVPFDAGTEITGASGAVFIPNTKTIMFLGYMRGGRYGIQYKGGDLQVLEVPSGGTTTRDFRDSDDYYWLMNTDDIASASTVNNVPLYQYGIFDENRWYDKGSTWQSLQSGEDRGGTLTSCTYDPATKRLYVIHRGIQESSQVGTSRRSQIVSVYLLNF
jgi:predicted RNA-binding protein with TRAM domain